EDPRAFAFPSQTVPHLVSGASRARLELSMSSKDTLNPLVRAISEQGDRARRARFLAGGLIVALGVLLAPTASAQFSYCLITGQQNAECGTNVTYTATSPFLSGQTLNATWSLLNNTAGASFVGGNSCTNVTTCQVVVTTSHPGS